MATESSGSHTNRLGQATSPYLRQHAENPVDWYEWGPEALARARREDRPIFLSIGYSACHWCHVMAHESFEHPAIAALLNEHFVNIKVDREERPDLDEIYMQATLVLNQGQGGWPMSVWLTPQLKPFFAGTYFPPQARYGRPGFRELCEAIARAWKLHRDDITAQADKLTELVRAGLEPVAAGGGGERGTAVVDAAAERLAGAFDPVSGGLASGGTNKFPPSLALDVLLRSATRRRTDSARRRQFLRLVEVTLDHMAAGGICDQLGGGFHRYSTDVEWHVPHFEKMLYDQALVSRAYLDAWQVLRKPRYAGVAREVFDYVLADLRDPGGGFCSARDADSEGVEGRYYVWTRAEVLAALGKQDGELFCAHYDVSESGNWRDPHDPGTPKSVLRELRSYECCGKLFGVTPEECERRLRAGRARLLALRAQRVPPARDEKVLAEWNGLMIASLARGGCVLGEPRYVAAAAAAAEFVLANQRVDGRLRRAWRAGRTSGAAFLSDYAALIEGLIELYEATFERRWLEYAAELNDVVQTHHADRDGGFYATADDHEPLIARSRDVRDGAVPSGTAVQLMNLLRLAVLLGRDDFRAQAEHTLAGLAGEMASSPWTTERLLAAQDFAAAGPVELRITGDVGSAAGRELLRSVYEAYVPNRVLMWVEAGDGQVAAHVCRGGTCGRPVTRADALREVLAAS